MHIKSLTSINCCWMSNNEDGECFVQSGAEQYKTYKELSDNPAMQWANWQENQTGFTIHNPTYHNIIGSWETKQADLVASRTRSPHTSTYKASCKSRKQFCTQGKHWIPKTIGNLTVQWWMKAVLLLTQKGWHCLIYINNKWNEYRLNAVWTHSGAFNYSTLLEEPQTEPSIWFYGSENFEPDIVELNLSSGPNFGSEPNGGCTRRLLFLIC